MLQVRRRGGSAELPLLFALPAAAPDPAVPPQAAAAVAEAEAKAEPEVMAAEAAMTDEASAMIEASMAIEPSMAAEASMTIEASMTAEIAAVEAAVVAPHIAVEAPMAARLGELDVRPGREGAVGPNLRLRRSGVGKGEAGERRRRCKQQLTHLRCSFRMLQACTATTRGPRGSFHERRITFCSSGVRGASGGAERRLSGGIDR